VLVAGTFPRLGSRGGCPRSPSTPARRSASAGCGLARNSSGPGVLDRAPGTRSRFAALAAPLVRINVATDAPGLPGNACRRHTGGLEFRKSRFAGDRHPQGRRRGRPHAIAVAPHSDVELRDADDPRSRLQPSSPRYMARTTSPPALWMSVTSESRFPKFQSPCVTPAGITRGRPGASVATLIRTSGAASAAKRDRVPEHDRARPTDELRAKPHPADADRLAGVDGDRGIRLGSRPRNVPATSTTARAALIRVAKPAPRGTRWPRSPGGRFTLPQIRRAGD